MKSISINKLTIFILIVSSNITICMDQQLIYKQIAQKNENFNKNNALINLPKDTLSLMLSFITPLDKSINTAAELHYSCKALRQKLSFDTLTKTYKNIDPKTKGNALQTLFFNMRYQNYWDTRYARALLINAQASQHPPLLLKTALNTDDTGFINLLLKCNTTFNQNNPLVKIPQDIISKILLCKPVDESVEAAAQLHCSCKSLKQQLSFDTLTKIYQPLNQKTKNEILKKLFNDINQKNYQDRQFAQAIQEKHFTRAILINAGAQGEISQTTPLLETAVKNNDSALIKLLLKCEANPNEMISSISNLPIIFDIQTTEIATIFDTYSSGKYKINWNAVSNESYPNILWATINKSPKLMQFYLNHNVNTKIERDGFNNLQQSTKKYPLSLLHSLIVFPTNSPKSSETANRLYRTQRYYNYYTEEEINNCIHNAQLLLQKDPGLILTLDGDEQTPIQRAEEALTGFKSISWKHSDKKHLPFKNYESSISEDEITKHLPKIHQKDYKLTTKLLKLFKKNEDNMYRKDDACSCLIF